MSAASIVVVAAPTGDAEDTAVQAHFSHAEVLRLERLRRIDKLAVRCTEKRRELVVLELRGSLI